MKVTYIILFWENVPKDLTTALWIGGGGLLTAVIYLYLSKEKLKTHYDDKIEKLNIEFSKYKDKTHEEKIETIEKVLVTITSFEKAIEDLPEKFSQSVSMIRQDLERMLHNERNNNGR